MIGRQFVQIANRAAQAAKDKRPQFAEVVRVDGVRVDLKIGQSRNVTKNIEVIGDASQLTAGDAVQIAWWANDRPVAIAGTVLDETTERLDNVETRLDAIDITRPTSTPNTTGGIADWQILRFSKGALASVHNPDEAGLRDAADLCIDGDMVMLPALDLELDKTKDPVVFSGKITVQGLSRETSILRGQIDIENGCTLSGITVVKIDNSDDTNMIAVSVSGDCKVADCNIHGLNCGAADAYGFDLAAGSHLLVRNSYLTGESEVGDGYAVNGVNAVIYDSQVYGSTDQYSDHSGVHVYGTTVGEAVIEKYIETYGCPNWPPDDGGGGDDGIPFDARIEFTLQTISDPIIQKTNSSINFLIPLAGAQLASHVSLGADDDYGFLSHIDDNPNPATITIPFTGQWIIQFRNCATFVPEAFSDGDKFSWSNKIIISGAGPDIELPVSGSVNGYPDMFSPIAQSSPYNSVRVLNGTTYYEYTMAPMQFTQGQKLTIKVDVNVNIDTIYADSWHALMNPQSTICVYPVLA